MLRDSDDGDLSIVIASCGRMRVDIVSFGDLLCCLSEYAILPCRFTLVRDRYSIVPERLPGSNLPSVMSPFQLTSMWLASRGLFKNLAIVLYCSRVSM